MRRSFCCLRDDLRGNERNDEKKMQSSYRSGENRRDYPQVQLLMEHDTGKDDWEIKADSLEQAAVLKMTVTKISIKEHI